MKKVLALLLAMVFAATTPVMAAGTTLNDSELDSIDAGSYVVITDTDGNESVVDVFENSNDFLINDEAQEEIQAVSNANVIDSAVAVQTNIANVTGNEPISNDINQSNEANIINYNPSDYDLATTANATEWHSTNDTSNTLSVITSSSENHVDWSKLIESDTFSLAENLTIDFDYAAAGEGRSKTKESHEFAEVAVLDVDYNKDIEAGWAKDDETHVDWSSASDSNTTNVTTVSNTEWHSTDDSSLTESRKNKSEWNNLYIEDTAQTKLQVVSNLNSVSSGAAVQTNIASNVGVAGTIVHSNLANVVNGL